METLEGSLLMVISHNLALAGFPVPVEIEALRKPSDWSLTSLENFYMTNLYILL
jgi:hypothetical protein